MHARRMFVYCLVVLVCVFLATMFLLQLEWAIQAFSKTPNGAWGPERYDTARKHQAKDPWAKISRWRGSRPRLLGFPCCRAEGRHIRRPGPR